MPEVDFDALDLPSTGTLPVGVPGAGREGVRGTVSSREALLGAENEVPEDQDGSRPSRIARLRYS